MIPQPPTNVSTVLKSYPPLIAERLLELRRLILETAAETEGVGPLHETLKWNEAAYLSQKPKSGTTIRIGAVADQPDQYALFVNCQTTLVATFRQWFPTVLSFDRNRAIMFRVSEPLPKAAVATCIGAALTYDRSTR
jgi:hypothetical protein